MTLDNETKRRIAKRSAVGIRQRWLNMGYTHNEARDVRLEAVGAALRALNFADVTQTATPSALPTLSTEALAEAAAREVLDQRGIPASDTSALQSLAWSLGTERLPYETGLAQLVGVAVDIARMHADLANSH